MKIWLNGALTEADDGLSVVDAVGLAGHSGGTSGVAVAVNGEVVTKSSWVATQLSDGDKVEVLVAAQGG
jgi:sulfur carrier protein